jgi:hypothetical protein
MDPAAVVAAGLIATAADTLLIYALPALGFPRLDLLGLVGSYFTSRRRMAYVLGTLVHFGGGVGLAFLYAWLWSRGWGAPTWGWGLLFGAIQGVLAMIAFPLALATHPRPPQAGLPLGWLLEMFLGSTLYGLVAAVIYAALAGGV